MQSMGHLLRHRSAELLVLTGATLLVAFAGACNSLTGVGDLHVSGAGGESAAGGGTTRPGAGGGGVGGAGIGGAGVGPGSSASAGNGTPSSSVTGTATTTSAGPATTTGPSTVASSTGTSMSNDPAQFCVDTINSYRATLGKPAMTRWSSNEACVASEATTDEAQMSAHYAFIHGTTCTANAQNECPGYSTNPLDPNDGIATCLQLMWDEKNQAGCSGCDTCDFPYQNCTNCTFDSTSVVCGHYLNMKSTVLTKVACGFATTWYAQDYK